jgi:hypothetical protein
MSYANYFEELAKKTQCKIKTSVVVNGSKAKSEAQKNVQNKLAWQRHEEFYLSKVGKYCENCTSRHTCYTRKVYKSILDDKMRQTTYWMEFAQQVNNKQI